MFIEAHPGPEIIEAGESGFDFFVILSGEAEVLAGGQSISRLGPGEVFGEMGLEGHGKRNADVIARTIMSLIAMMVWDYRAIEQEHPEIGQATSPAGRAARRRPSSSGCGSRRAATLHSPWSTPLRFGRWPPRSFPW